MEYRPGNLDDLDEICNLIHGAVEKMEEQGIHQWDEIYPAREDFEEDIRKRTLHVAADDETILAVYVVSEECDEEYHACSWEGEDSRACILHRFCVNAEFQHKGIGAQILGHIEDQIRAMGYDSVRLDAFSENPYSLRLYGKNGYEIRGTAVWRKGLFYLMEKNLKEQEPQKWK